MIRPEPYLRRARELSYSQGIPRRAHRFLRLLWRRSTSWRYGTEETGSQRADCVSPPPELFWSCLGWNPDPRRRNGNGNRRAGLLRLPGQGVQAGRAGRCRTGHPFWRADRAVSVMTPRHKVQWLDGNESPGRPCSSSSAHRSAPPSFRSCAGMPTKMLGVVDLREPLWRYQKSRPFFA